MRGNAQEWTLLPLRYTRHVKAERGENGGKNQLTGAYGADVYINVPIGTIAKNEEINFNTNSFSLLRIREWTRQGGKSLPIGFKV